LFLGGGGFENELEVEGKGGVVLTMINEIEDVIFVLEEAFNEEGGGDEGFSVEDGSVHDEKRFGCEEAVWLGCEFFRRLSEETIATSFSSYSF
jgi:hypothetical protein